MATFTGAAVNIPSINTLGSAVSVGAYMYLPVMANLGTGVTPSILSNPTPAPRFSWG
jgi:hypothetical protein